MEGDRVMVPPYQQYRLYGQPKEYNFYLCISPVYVSIIMVKFDLLNQWYFHAIHDATMPLQFFAFCAKSRGIEASPLSPYASL